MASWALKLMVILLNLEHPCYFLQTSATVTCALIFTQKVMEDQTPQKTEIKIYNTNNSNDQL